MLGGITNTGATASVESYSPTTNSWTGETSLPVAVDKEAVTVDSLGRVVVAGGYDTTGAATAAVYVSQQLNQADASPVITSTAPTSVIAGMLYSYQVLSTGNPQPTYSLTAAPAGMTIDTATGLITWTPTLSQVGSQTITVQATNFSGQTTQTFSVNTALSLPVFTTGSTLPQWSSIRIRRLPSRPRAPLADVQSQLGSHWHDDRSGYGRCQLDAERFPGSNRRQYLHRASPEIIPAQPRRRSATRWRRQLPPTYGRGDFNHALQLSWPGSSDPNVVGYEVTQRFVAHGGKGSGGTVFWNVIASNVTGNSYTISGLAPGAGGTYAIEAVNSAGVVSGFPHQPVASLIYRRVFRSRRKCC